MARSVLLVATLLVSIAAGCRGTEDSSLNVSPVPTGGLTPHLHTPPQLALDLWELKPSEGEVSQAIAAQHPDTPDYTESTNLAWFIPSLFPSPTDPNVKSFVMLDRYEEAGLQAYATNSYFPPQNQRNPMMPFWIIVGIAKYGDSEGAEAALNLGARIYAAHRLGSPFWEAAAAGEEMTETLEVSGLGDGAIVDRLGQTTAVSVRVKNYIGTVMTVYTRHATDVMSDAKALAAVLAEHLATAP